MTRAELCLYEEVVKLPPFKRKTLVLIGANGVGRRTLKSKILESQPHRFSAPLPHTSRIKRPEEDNGFRYWFVDREDMELSIRQAYAVLLYISFADPNLNRSSTAQRFC